ncbi:hypothetical protein EVJ58_g4562 [Rhodofomes roseus]|uniref:Uncharacterized protein n=1 Tax=Rhodofomes roseus TaxID=34475 RepID=A0A4Y9YI03_9APHY|nr:hypothetical protein EVJ58_g4562 [Rhodofomes roseus]
MNHASLRRSAVLLSCSRQLRAVRHCAQRTLATATESDASESDIDFPPPLSAFSRKRYKSTDSIPPEARSVFVRPWDGISSMPELLAMVRGIERHYGRIREYSVLRDYDFSAQYVPYFWVNFADPASLALVPETPSLLKIDVPVTDHARPGGIGLDDIQSLLAPEDYVSSEDVAHEATTKATSTDERKMVTVDLRIERAKIPFELGVHRRKPPNIGYFQGSFYEWGGFYKLPSLEAVHPAATMRMGVEYRNRGRNILKGAADADVTEEDAEDAEDTPDMPAKSAMADEAAFASSSTLSPIEAYVSYEHTASDAATSYEATDAAPTPEPNPSAQAARLSSKREQILARARVNARTPLPASALQTGEEKRQQEREEEKRVQTSVRERLWRLVGSKWL